MEVIKDGWMFKCGGRIKTWYKRWFTLVGTELIYAKNPGVKEQGRINLNEATYIGEAPDCKRQPAIQIVTPSRTYYLQANSVADQTSWIETILQVTNKSEAIDETIDETKIQTIRLLYSGISLTTATSSFLIPLLLVRHTITKVLYFAMIMPKPNMTFIQDIYSRINSPYIQKLSSSFSKGKNQQEILTSFSPSIDLPTILLTSNSFSESAVRLYAAELFLAIIDIHSVGQALVPFNDNQIWITQNGHIRLFWIPTTIKEDQFKEEVLENYTKFWKIIFQMLSGFSPDEISDTENDLPYSPEISEVARDLIEQLRRSVKDNPSQFPEIVKYHPFFSEIQWNDIAKQEGIAQYPIEYDNIDKLWLDEVYSQDSTSLLLENALGKTF